MSKRKHAKALSVLLPPHILKPPVCHQSLQYLPGVTDETGEFGSQWQSNVQVNDVILHLPSVAVHRPGGRVSIYRPHMILRNEVFILNHMSREAAEYSKATRNMMEWRDTIAPLALACVQAYQKAGVDFDQAVQELDLLKHSVRKWRKEPGFDDRSRKLVATAELCVEQYGDPDADRDMYALRAADDAQDNGVMECGHASEVPPGVLGPIGTVMERHRQPGDPVGESDVEDDDEQQHTVDAVTPTEWRHPATPSIRTSLRTSKRRMMTHGAKTVKTVKRAKAVKAPKSDTWTVKAAQPDAWTVESLLACQTGDAEAALKGDELQRQLRKLDWTTDDQLALVCSRWRRALDRLDDGDDADQHQCNWTKQKQYDALNCLQSYARARHGNHTLSLENFLVRQERRQRRGHVKRVAQ